LPSFTRETEFVALTSKDEYAIYDGDMGSTDTATEPVKNYRSWTNEYIVPHSSAKYCKHNRPSLMVGALARLNLNRESLHKSVRKDAAKYLLPFPSKNIFHNNLAQAIEMLHCIDHSVELLETTDFKDEKPAAAAQKRGIGVGVIEAPRGTLYYMMNVDNMGKIIEGNLVIPTAQNQIWHLTFPSVVCCNVNSIFARDLKK